MPQIQYIGFLALLGIVPLLWLLYLFVLAIKRATIKKIGDPALVQQLTASYSSSKFRQKFFLVLAAIGMLIIALANVRTAESEQKIDREGIDIMIALDVSKSMLAQDVKPNRLERAKQVLNRLVDKLSDDRVGIVVFAGKAYLQMPLTGDLAAAKMYLSAATTESVPTQGTVVGDALKMCNLSFNNKEKKYKAVILISDGEDHDTNAEKVAEEMAKLGVVIYTVGIGSPQGAPLYDEISKELKRDEVGNPVVSKLNEEVLRLVAGIGNGQYFLFQNTDATVSSIVSQLSSMDQRMVKDDSLINYKSYFQMFIALAFLFMILEVFISERKITKKQTLPLKRVFTLCLLFLGGPVFSQSKEVIKGVKEGNEAYNKRQFDQAGAYYSGVIQSDPDNAIAHFNLGNAKFRLGQKNEAINSYDRANERLTEPIEKSNAFYNKGVVLQNDKKIAECIEAYKNALKLYPENEDARQNLQQALKQQKKEKQKQNDKQKQKNRDQEPKPNPSKLTKEDADNKLKALMQQEKNLQDKLHKVNASAVNKPQKDW